MKIREKIYTIDYLSLNPITFEKWQLLAENCFDTDYIDYINAVMNAKIIFNEMFRRTEEKEYLDTLDNLNLHKINIINKLTSDTVKIKRKIQK